MCALAFVNGVSLVSNVNLSELLSCTKVMAIERMAFGILKCYTAVHHVGNARIIFSKHPGQELISSDARTYEVKFTLSTKLVRVRDA